MAIELKPLIFLIIYFVLYMITSAIISITRNTFNVHCYISSLRYLHHINSILTMLWGYHYFVSLQYLQCFALPLTRFIAIPAMLCVTTHAFHCNTCNVLRYHSRVSLQYLQCFALPLTRFIAIPAMFCVTTHAFHCNTCRVLLQK